MSDDAQTYLTGAFDQVRAAVARGDGDAAEHIVDRMDGDGFQAAAAVLGEALTRTCVAGQLDEES